MNDQSAPPLYLPRYTRPKHWLDDLAPDLVAMAVLIGLWLLFFWQLFTPNIGDQASLKPGDFSGQFMAFGGYQYARWTAGEVPLWTPYNNGGLPFIADTQAAVFYPPRLLTIALAHLSGTGWTYHALELEMTFHVLAYTLAVYLLLRRMTGDRFAGVIAAVIGGYGGYLSGYPPLQLALLEAGIWLPLAVLGIYEATRHGRIQWRWLVLTGWTLGLSWLAGHPQTSFFLTYLLVAYWLFRVWSQRAQHAMPRQMWRIIPGGVILFGGISLGVVAVTLFPGLEYLLLTSRSDLDFAAKGGGFPFQDVIQLLLPGVVSLFSPLYIGLSGLALVGYGIYSRLRDMPAARRELLFWLVVALFALLLSFGARTPLYALLYEIVPGLRFFRGQERAAYLVVNSLIIIAGMGAAALSTRAADQRPVRRWLAGLLALCGVLVAGLTLLWLADPTTNRVALNAAVFSTLIAGALLVILPPALVPGQDNWRLGVLALLVIELFSVNQGAASNYDPIPPQAQVQPSPLLDIPRQDLNQPFRVDGFRVLGGNYGSLYGLADIQGISPLFLGNIQEIVEAGLPDEIAWELFAVRYVWSDWDALPVPGVVLATGADERGPVKLHQLTAPRPYTLLLYDAVTVASDEAARQLLADPEFAPRDTVILDRDPGIDLPGSPPERAGTTITAYAPEHLTVITDTPIPAVLSIAQVDYPGWRATVDGQPVATLRAYGGLIALAVPAGQHTVTLTYDPLTYRVGFGLSLVTWGGLIILTLVWGMRGIRRAITDHQ